MAFLTEENYKLVDRGGWPVHVHNEKLVWIVEYDAVERTLHDNGRPGHWSVYYAIEKRKKGLEHWAHDNKRLGDFLTLEEAKKAGDEHGN